MQAEKARVFILMALLCAIIVGFVASNAYTSKIQYEINSLNRQVQETERRIQNIEVKIKSASNITTIESKAFALGMSYPGFDEIVYLRGEPQIEDLALALMEAVYR